MAIKNLDESRIKARDLDLLFRVERLLTQYGLNGEIVGSVAKGVEEGTSYRDIDVKVSYDNTNGRYNAIMDLKRASDIRFLQSIGTDKRLVDRCKEISELLGEPALSTDEQARLYVDTIVENRFNFRKGRTNIDLCFEGSPKMRERLKSMYSFDSDAKYSLSAKAGLFLLD